MRSSIMMEDLAIKLYDLLLNQGVYGKVQDVTPSEFYKFVSSDGFPTLDLYCPNCKENKTFVYDGTETVNGLGFYRNGTASYPAIRTINYHCPSCLKRLFFAFYYNNEIVFKLAQYPSLFDVSRDELKKYQKNDLIDKDSFSQLYKAETCASSGYYVAAYTYMRRVYETMLMSVFEQNQEDIGITEEDFRRLHSDKKLEAIKDYLAIDDEIYLPLYGLLSAGIHAMTEEQCCEDYTVLKPILLEILAEQKAKKEKAAKRKELKELFAKRKGEMK